MAYYGRDIPKNEMLRSFSGDLLQVNTGDAMSTILDAPGVTSKAITAAEQYALETPESTEAYNALRELNGFAPVDPGPVLSPEELNDEFGWTGATYDYAMPRRSAELIAEQKRQENLRNDVLGRAPDTWASKSAQFGAALLHEAVDPLGAATMFIPIVGEARLAGWLAKQTAAQRALTRVGAGFTEGAAGGAPLALLEYAASQRLQLDYDMSDVLLETAFGGVLGGGFHSIGGAMGDMVRSFRSDTRREALRSAVAQAASGKSIDVTQHVVMDAGEGRIGRRLMETTTITPATDPGGYVGATLDMAEIVPVRADLGVRPGRIPLSADSYPNREIAQQVADQLTDQSGIVVSVTRKPDGRYAVTRDAPVEVIRNDDGTATAFSDKKRASKAATRQGDGWRAVDVAGKWHVAQVTPDQVAAIKAHPELLELGTGPDLIAQRKQEMANEIAKRIPAGQKAIREAVTSLMTDARIAAPRINNAAKSPKQVIDGAVKNANSPAAESMADPVASSEISRIVAKAESEAEGLDAAAIDNEFEVLRRAEQVDKSDEEFLTEIDEILDNFATAAQRAAFCMSRNS
jgi:hypothetical protein